MFVDTVWGKEVRWSGRGREGNPNSPTCVPHSCSHSSFMVGLNNRLGENSPDKYHPWLMQELKDIYLGVGAGDNGQLHSSDENYEDSSNLWQHGQYGLDEL